MNIIGIELKNFKTFKNLKIECNERFNVIIGPNNIGKSTILEAIFLWKSAYDNFIQERNGKKFYVGYNNRYLSFKDLYFLRAIEDSDIFYGDWDTASIKLVFKIDNQIVRLGFNFEKPGIRNSYLKVNYNGSQPDFDRFSELMELKGVYLKDAIFIYQTKPISQITKEEPFFNNAQLLKKISLAKSHELIRNKILKTQNRQSYFVHERFKTLEDRLSAVFGKRYNIRCKNRNTIDDEFVKITIREDNKSEVDIALMGSGFLQVVEIFSTLEFVNKDPKVLNLILIDEPDSHIHSNMQFNLLDELKKQTNYQSFVISHNDRLIDNIPEGELLFLNDDIKKMGHLYPSPVDTYGTIRDELASKFCNITIEPNIKCFILTEDEKFDLIKSFLLYNGFEEETIEIISYYGCDTIGSAIAIGKYIKTKNPDANILIHRDRDYLTNEEIEEIKMRIETLGFSFYCTKGVDIESEFINAHHINALYNNISIEKAEELIELATKDVERDSVDRLLKKKGQQKKFGIEIIDMYNSDIKRYRYSKKVLSRLKGYIQNEIKTNPNLISQSDFIQNSTLKELSDNIWYN
ncbi:AAA family ATPase [Paludibacter sp.]|uniref:ATP-dependent nuclease n=1 Tax=Paludibacter sp. TaxID=1898105 RepID=UPI0013530242|nr:AAA family ATPase [Paludibacter sp.]MTK53067.1 AAA family ATPase [Paludibacter sp.]